MRWEHGRLGHIPPRLSSSRAPRGVWQLGAGRELPRERAASSGDRPLPTSLCTIGLMQSGEANIESDGITPLSWHRRVAEAHRFLCLLKSTVSRFAPWAVPLPRLCPCSCRGAVGPPCLARAGSCQRKIGLKRQQLHRDCQHDPRLNERPKMEQNPKIPIFSNIVIEGWILTARSNR
ncbi:uncharacterized protein ACIBXB_016065 isoform 2-T4 [Morphnus guianensis]